MNIYKRLETLCEKKGVTISAMAHTLNISPSSIWRLKDQKNNLTRSTAEKIAVYFQIPVEELYSDNPEAEINDELYAKRKILFNLSAKLSKDDLEKFIKMMKAVIDY